MTEKRFTQKDEDDWEILDRNKHFAFAHSGYQAEKIIRELNELVETNRGLYKENRQLKQNIGELGTVHAEEINKIEDAFDKEILKLEKENEQLKSEIKGMNELLKSYRKTVKHDAKLLADATKKGYLPPLEDWERGVIK